MSYLRRIVKILGLGLLLTAASACSQHAPPLGNWSAPPPAAQFQEEPWPFGEDTGKTLILPHYRIHTTIREPEMQARLATLLEAAYSRYSELASGIPLSDKPMECFIFRNRTQWEVFTRNNTGRNAPIYLQIVAGGYEDNGRFVTYFIGGDTYSVTAHEGWHLFCANNFKRRLPPFLEEGIACMFERIVWQDELPRWNLMINMRRADTLRRAFEARELWPLDFLISHHAGEIVGEKMERISTWYAQNWAFARFLWDGEGAKYRPAFKKWLEDTASGHLFAAPADPQAEWDRNAAKPLLEHYLGTDLATLEMAYTAYMRKIAYQEQSQQEDGPPN